jgi:hypothetical protein
MRTRTRTTSSSSVVIPSGPLYYSFVACDGTTLTSNIPQANPITQLTDYVSETMIDSLGRRESHPVKHTKVKVACQGGGQYVSADVQTIGGVAKDGVSTITNPDYLRYSNALNHIYCVDSLNQTIGSLGNGWSLGTSPVSEQSLINDCLESASRLDADVLLDIVEANQMYPSIKSIATALPNMAKNWTKLRKVIRTASGSFLAWKFGVSPVFHDIMAVDRSLRVLHDKFRKHEKMQLVRSSRAVSLNATFAGIAFAPSNQNGFRTWTFTHTGRCTRAPALRFVLVTKPIVPYSLDLFKKLDYAMRRFATSPASLAWELVPFSFVVDWFIDVRSALNAVDATLGHKPYEIVSFTRSLSYTLCNDTSVTRCNPCNGGTLYSSPMGSTERSYYERSLVPQSGFLPHWAPRFGKNQAAISAALISQALSKR